MMTLQKNDPHSQLKVGKGYHINKLVAANSRLAMAERRTAFGLTDDDH